MLDLQIGGLTPITTIDYPGELAAIVFCQGCPWHCSYCHNDELRSRSEESAITWKEVKQLLQRRQGLLDAVVFSGGEPTLQKDLGKAMSECRELGYKVGLHTAGIYPQRLNEVLHLVDWIGLDIKALPEDYDDITAVPNSAENAWRSLDLILESKIDVTIRTTWNNQLFSKGRLETLQNQLTQKGITQHSIQALISHNI